MKTTPAQKKLAALRKKGWQMIQLSTALGCSQPAIYKWLRGSEPSPAALEALLALPANPPPRETVPGRPLGSKNKPK